MTSVSASANPEIVACRFEDRNRITDDGRASNKRKAARREDCFRAFRRPVVRPVVDDDPVERQGGLRDGGLDVVLEDREVIEHRRHDGEARFQVVQRAVYTRVGVWRKG